MENSHWGDLLEALQSARTTLVVCNRTPRNELELHLAHFSGEILSGSALCDLHLPPRHDFQVSSEDVVGKVWPLAVCRVIQALQDLAARCEAVAMGFPSKVLASNNELMV